MSSSSLSLEAAKEANKTLQTERSSESFYMHNGQVLKETLTKEEKEQRIFKGILSGEVVDKEGDIIPIAEFAKFFPILMKRHTPILLKHQPIHVGKILVLDTVNYNGIPAVLVKVQIFDDFPKDHETWEGLLNGEFFGMSFTGDVESTIVKCDNSRCYKERKLAAIYEITITNRPANQESKILEFLTKEHAQASQAKDKDKLKGLIQKQEGNKMTDGQPPGDTGQKVEVLSKEDLKTLFVDLGTNLSKAIVEGFETVNKSLLKEEKPKPDPKKPDEEEEEEDKEKDKEKDKDKDKGTSKTSKEDQGEEKDALTWESLAEKISKEVEAQIEKKTTKVTTPPATEEISKEEVSPTYDYSQGLPTEQELANTWLQKGGN